jgi:mRNA-degrading endonuclease toxin of MazEF toxin-antitoxin module
MSTPDIKQGEIYWVDIPKDHTRGSEQYKRRPYIIVSRTAVNKVCQTVVGVPLSTAVDPKKAIQHPFRVVIPPREIVKDAGYSGEIRLSLAKTDQVRVLDKSRLETRLGALSATATAAVGGGLAFLFDVR